MRSRHAWTGLGLVAALLPALARAAEAAPAPAPAPRSADQSAPLIAEIVFTGNRRWASDRLMFQLRSRVGSPLRPSDVAADVRTLNTMGPFIDGRSSVEFLDNGQARLIFSVTELDLIRSITFDGLSYWDRSGLEKKISSRVGTHFNPFTAEADRRFLLEEFRAKALINLQVQIETAHDAATGTVDVVFRCAPGVPVQVANTFYRGLPETPARKLRDSVLPEGVYKLKLDQLLLFNKRGAPFQRDLLHLDEQTVVSAIQDAGYLDARLKNTEVSFYDDVAGYDERRRGGVFYAPGGQRDDRAMIRFHLDCAERYRLGSIRFVGNTVLSEEALRKLVELDDGDWYQRQIVQKGLDAARTAIRDLGYARANYRMDARPNLETHLVDVTVQIFEGTIYRFGRVDISGNTVTKDAAIRRLLAVEPGELSTETAITESRRQLTRTGLFKNGPGTPLAITPSFPADRPDEVDLGVELHEDATGQLSTSIGYVTSSGFVGRLQYKERNFDLLGLVTEGRFRGAGQTASATVEYAEQSQSLSLDWLNPHLFDSDYFLNFNFNYTEEQDSARDYDQTRLTPALSLGRYFLNRDISLAVGYRYNDLKVRNVDADAAPDILAGTYFENQIFFDQTLDLTDSRVLPTRGMGLTVRETWTGEPLAASADYTEIHSRLGFYLPVAETPLGGVTILTLRQTNNWLRGRNGDDPPFYERYYGGGEAPRHRGYDRGRQGPTVLNSLGDEVRNGGVVLWVTSLELSLPVQGINDGVRLVLFSDWGNVWGAGETVDLSDNTTAIGFGIRFPLALPIALDFAWLLDGPDDVPRQQVHFALGTINY